nr:hypothetical protein CFP56_00985 [Quercus suber]
MLKEEEVVEKSWSRQKLLLTTRFPNQCMLELRSKFTEVALCSTTKGIAVSGFAHRPLLPILPTQSCAGRQTPYSDSNSGKLAWTTRHTHTHAIPALVCLLVGRSPCETNDPIPVQGRAKLR